MSGDISKTEYSSFSDAKMRLEEIARLLEENDVTLERSIELYEEGAKLVAVCYEMLGSAKMRFTQVSVNNSGDE